MKCAQRPCFVHVPRVCHPCLNRNTERGLADKQRDHTDRYHPGVVGDEIAGCDVTSLVFVAPDIKGELHRALGTELITRAVLGQTRVKTFMSNLSQQEISSAPHQTEPTMIKRSTPTIFFLTHSGILHLIHNVIAGEWDETCGKKKIRGISKQDHGGTDPPAEARRGTAASRHWCFSVSRLISPTTSALLHVFVFVFLPTPTTHPACAQ